MAGSATSRAYKTGENDHVDGMPPTPTRLRVYARFALATIRLINGFAGLFMPAFLIRRLGGNPDAQPVALYAFRMFGIRTIVIGAELLLPEGAVRDHAQRMAPLIHASDTAAALLAGVRRQVPPRAAVTIALISGTNVVLSLLMQSPRRARSAFRTHGEPSSTQLATTPTTVDDLLDMAEPQLEDLFRRSPAGPIPNGDAQGTVIAAPPAEDVPTTLAERLISLFARWLVWQGKVFDTSRVELVNKVTAYQLRAIRARVYKGASWLDGQEAIILDYSHTSFIAQKIRDEIREVAPGLYLGLVYWGDTRVLDFALAFPSGT
jgi:hypothetical protein